jgi:hypothetical protein
LHRVVRMYRSRIDLPVAGEGEEEGGQEAVQRQLLQEERKDQDIRGKRLVTTYLNLNQNPKYLKCKVL